MRRISPRASAVRCFWPPERVTPRSPRIGVEPFGKAFDGFFQRRRVGDLEDLLVVPIRIVVGDVVAEAVGKQKRVLQHQTDPLAQELQREAGDRVVVQQDVAPVGSSRRTKSRSSVDLPGADPTDQRDGLSLVHVERDVVERILVLVLVR